MFQITYDNCFIKMRKNWKIQTHVEFNHALEFKISSQINTKNIFFTLWLYSVKYLYPALSDSSILIVAWQATFKQESPCKSTPKVHSDALKL